MQSFKSVILFAFILICSTASAQFYVSPSGSDSNPGSITLPFKTIQKAADVMSAGDSCLIMAGVYRETVIPANNGALGNPIIFKNYQNDKVIVVGTDSLSGWVPYQNGIYKTYAPDTVTQLCVNKQMANEARYPNFWGNHQSTAGWKPVTIATTGNAVYTGMNFPNGYWVGGYAVALVAAKWISENGIIDSSNANMVHCTERSFPWSTYTSTYYIGSGSGYITHHINALDTVNEWHWQNDSLYYYPSDPATINTSTIEARTRMFGFNCFGKEYIKVENINFVWSTVNFEEATGCTLNGGSVWFPQPYFYYTSAWDRQAHDSTNYGISSWRGKGVAVSGNNNTVSNCYVANSWGDGISVGGQNNTVTNCLVEDCDWTATDCGVVTTVGVGHLVSNNTLRKTGRSVVVNRLSNQTDIINNDMYDCGKMTLDLGITYSYHSNGGGSQIAYNWVHDNHSTSSSMGIYLDNFDTAYVVHHNVIWNCINAIQTNKPAVDHEIYNNTAWYCTNAMGTWGNTGTTIQNQIVRNNLSNKPWNLGNTFSNNLVSANPQFTNAAAHDFTLTPSSPAIDYGIDIPNITTGYVGAAPDAGAYEFGAPQWIPGSNVTAPDISEVYLDSTQTTGIYEYPTDAGLLLYPNPTTSIVNLSHESISDSKVEVYDIFGQLILSKRNCASVDLSTYGNGLYMFVVTDLKNQVSHSKMVVLRK